MVWVVVVLLAVILAVLLGVVADVVVACLLILAVSSPGPPLAGYLHRFIVGVY